MKTNISIIFVDNICPLVLNNSSTISSSNMNSSYTHTFHLIIGLKVNFKSLNKTKLQAKLNVWREVFLSKAAH